MGRGRQCIITAALGLLGLFACNDDTSLPASTAAEAGAPVVAPAPPRVLLYSKETEWYTPRRRSRRR